MSGQVQASYHRVTVNPITLQLTRREVAVLEAFQQQEGESLSTITAHLLLAKVRELATKGGAQPQLQG